MSLNWRERVLLLQHEDTYGELPSPWASAHAVLAKDLQITPLAGDRINRDLVRPFLGAQESAMVNKRVEASFRLDAVAAGVTALDAGTAPPHSALTRAAGLAETIVGPDATIQASPPTPDPDNAPTGSFTYTAGDPYQGVLDRTVTLECTAPGASGVAEFTVSAPATRHLTAHNETGVVMTDAQPFPLPGGATIEPTVGTDFAVGDTFTIDLTAPGTFYMPVSNNFDSAHAFVQLDRNRHPMAGLRSNFGFNLEANNYLDFIYNVVALFGEPTSEGPQSVDFSAFQDPIPVEDVSTPWFAIDGIEFPLRSWSVDLGQSVNKRSLVGQNTVEITDRQSNSNSVTIEAPDVATKNFFADIAANNATVAVEVIHGLNRGETVHLSAPRAELANPRYSEEQGVAMLQLDMNLLPTDAGNDELKIGIK